MGEFHLPYEEVPGGPIDMTVSAYIAGEINVRAGTIADPEHPGRLLPILLFDFATAAGQLPPIGLVGTPKMIGDVGDMVAAAAKSAVRHAGDVG